ncbi:MAG: arginine--tRNA ligase [Nitrospinota bacterium]
MRRALVPLLTEAFERARDAGELKSAELPSVILERPPEEAFGDWATNLALVLARSERLPPMEIAQRLLRHLHRDPALIKDIQVARPGFINFFIEPTFLKQKLREVEEQGEAYGRSSLGGGRPVQVEFVSANPTGPLHVGHGRGAVVGDVIASLLEAIGYRVEREYYINDAGNQMELLGRSTLARYREALGAGGELPPGGYRGEYVREIAAAIAEREGERLLGLPEEEASGLLAQEAGEVILKDIESCLREFGVGFDSWFSERSLFEGGAVERALTALEEKGHIYRRDGHRWLRTTPFGDEKDRVVVRADGRPTYLASDIAYHLNKYERGFEKVIDVWGADHHGYVPRVRAALQMAGRDPESFKVVLVQFVSLKRAGEQVSMSTRAGEFIELSEVMHEVGVDTARFFFLMRNADAPLEFDLELAKEESSENPVYYVQYGHVRCCGLFRKAEERGIEKPLFEGVNLERLELPEEMRLIKGILDYPYVVESSALALEPHRLPYYLVELAKELHSYYNRHRILTDDRELVAARLFLASCIRTVLGNALKLLGVTAPERM